MRYIALAGRVLYSAIFLTTFTHFSPQAIGFAAQQGVPAAGLLVPLSGVIALAGALSVLLGYRARVGAWLIAMFLKNLSMLGAALLISQLGAGPLSLDARRRAARA